MEARKTDVLIVGAGPTGLMAANQLARFGIDFIIIDKKSGPTKESRAIAVTARSLEIYEQMGLVEEVLSNGKQIKSFNLYDAGKSRAAVPIGEIGKGLSRFSYMLAYEQSKNEELLYNALVRSGHQVDWNSEFGKLREHTTSIEAEVMVNGTWQVIHANYLIACDGASSPVRIQLNFSFPGGTYDNKFFVADTILQWSQGYDKLIIAPGKENFCGFLPMYGERHYRVLGTLPKRFREEENISFGDIEFAIKKNLGVQVSFESVNWFSTYRLHHRAVDHFSEGHVFLAGDSAHIHSPAGGQGMNTGLQDAYNIAWKLAMVINGEANLELLSTYNEERLPFAKWLISFTDRGFNTMTSTNPFIRFFRQNIALLVANMFLSVDFIRRFAFKTISQIGWSYTASSLSHNASKQRLKFKAGDRLPYLEGTDFYTKFRNNTFHFLHIGGQTSTNTELIRYTIPFPVTVVDVPLDQDWKKLGVKAELFVLVRPDNYIMAIADNMESLLGGRGFAKYFSMRK